MNLLPIDDIVGPRGQDGLIPKLASIIEQNRNTREPAMADNACILKKPDNTVLVRAGAGQVVQLGESWYFHPDCIDHSRFEVSDRVYTCPEKGTCFWVDLQTDKGFLNDVAWVYPQTKQGFEHIAGWYGFFTDHRHYYYSECD